jgi:phage terminase large subunit
LGVTLWEKQGEILEALARHPQVAVKSGHGVGKSFLAACAAHWFLYCFSPSLVLTTAPSRRQVEKVLWKEIRLRFRKARPALPGICLKTQLEVSDEQTAFGFTADSPEAAAGQHCERLLLIVDEASGIPPAIYEALQGALTSAHCHLLLIGNPTLPHGPFYDAFFQDTWETFTIACTDSPNFTAPEGEVPFPSLITPAWVERRRREWGEDSDAYRVRVLGEFPKQSADSLIPLDWVQTAENGDDADTGARVAGCDIARSGGCKNVFVLRNGGNVEKLVSWTGLDLVETAAKIGALCREYAVETVVVDGTGMGQGVVDQLTAMRKAGQIAAWVIDFKSGERATRPEEFSSRRDEAFWTLRQRYHDRRIHHRTKWPALVGQLTQIKYGFLGTTIKVESKQQMQKRGLKSPDEADALAMAFAPVTKRPPVAALGSIRTR